METAKKMVHLIGAGSIGSFTDLLLTVISRNLELELAIYDFDSVEPHNTINQLFWKGDAGTVKNKVFKVTALKKIMSRFTNAKIYAQRQKVNETSVLSEIVVVMVDKIEERKKIFQAVKYNAGVTLFIDARSGGKHAVVYALDPRIADHVRRYEKTLEGVAVPAPCADARTLPILSLIAGTVGQLIILYYKEESPFNFSQTLINIDGLPIISSSIY